MAVVAALLGEEITVGATPVEYQITETTIHLTRPTQEFAIEVDSANSGTIKFAVGVTPPATQRAYAAGSKIVLSGVENGIRNIWAVGSGAGQKFIIT
jgi:hypothetical protein